MTLLLACLAAQQVAAQECQRLILETPMPSNEELPVYLYAGAKEGVRGVLLLQPGINAAGDALLNDPSWQQFGRKERLVLMGVGFKTGKVNVKTNGYYYPEQGSGPAIVRAVEMVCAKAGITAQPILMFGFSGGAHFAHRFALWP